MAGDTTIAVKCASQRSSSQNAGDMLKQGKLRQFMALCPGRIRQTRCTGRYMPAGIPGSWIMALLGFADSPWRQSKRHKLLWTNITSANRAGTPSRQCTHWEAPTFFICQMIAISQALALVSPHMPAAALVYKGQHKAVGRFLSMGLGLTLVFHNTCNTCSLPCFYVFSNSPGQQAPPPLSGPLNQRLKFRVWVRTVSTAFQPTCDGSLGFLLNKVPRDISLVLPNAH